MNKAPYMNRQEVEDYLRLGSMADMAVEMAERTQEKSWKQKLKSIGTYCFNIATDRLKYVNNDELIKIKRRVASKQVLIYEKDEAKMLEERLSGKGKNILVDVNAWVLLLKVIDNYICRNCAQGCQVKNCEIRKILHASMAPIYQDDPANSECEFHWESKKYDIDIKLKENKQ